jgi:putative oxidoreductase
MKIVSTAARVLLGLVFTVFGLNGFLHFIPMGPLPAGLAGQYVAALAMSHYMSVVFAFELVSGVLLLLNRYVPLALAALAGIILNILLFHIFMAPAGLPLALVTAILWIGAIWNVRAAFAGLLRSRPEPQIAEPVAPASEGWAAADR